MTTKVLAIGLDSADRKLYEQWMREGKLPRLQQLRQRGTYVPLKSIGIAQAEASWTATISGTSPYKNGFWSQLRFDPKEYKINNLRSYQYADFPPFYALGDQYRVAAFDIPQVRLVDDVNGIQVLAYGAHSPQTPRVSRPENLLSEVIAKYGDHPGIERDFARLWWKPSMQKLRRRLIKGAGLRGKICADMIREQDWDLFFTVFGEVHSAGHYFWHLSQTDHPLYEAMKGQLGDGDPLLEVAQSVDQAVGEIIDAAGPDTEVVVFSQEGMNPNNLDLPSLLFLPEMLYRLNFPGKRGFYGGDAGTNRPPKDMIARPLWTGWSRGVWSLQDDANPVRDFARRYLPLEAGRYINEYFGGNDGLKYPYHARPHYQIPVWYRHHWPKMNAFALPSFSDGYVRVNLKGREANGVVEPEDYNAVCESLTAEIMAMRNARTGKPIAGEIVRTRSGPDEENGLLHDGDLVIHWDPDPADVVDSATVGRIGPIPHKRTGGHNDLCFAVMGGPSMPQNATFNETSALDLAPTIRTLLGANIPSHYDGKAIEELFTASAA